MRRGGELPEGAAAGVPVRGSAGRRPGGAAAGDGGGGGAAAVRHARR